MKRDTLRIKKIKSKYEYLLTELEETQFLFKEYEKIFYDDIPNQRPVINIPEPELEENIHEQEPEPEPEPKSESIIDEQIKTIYKKLSLLIHPDRKGGSSDDFKELHKYYKEKDLSKMVLLACRMNIEIENFEYTWEELDNVNSELNTKIDTIKKSVAWVYYFANPEQKQEIVNYFSNLKK